MKSTRIDWRLIADWIPAKATVLDLGCGHGALLAFLQQQRQIKGLGLEIEAAAIQTCVERGIAVIEQDLNQGLARFPDHSQHTVVMTQALQVLKRPDQLLDEMLRVAEQAIITLPNFGHWTHRSHLVFRGRMPVSKSLPHPWYTTPNIHLCTLQDFEWLCQQMHIRQVDRYFLNLHNRCSRMSRLWPNLFCGQAIYRVSRETTI